MADIAKRINAYYKKIVACYDTALDHAHDAGKLLTQAKRAEKHGDWGEWLADNFDGSARSAQLYMDIDEHWHVIEQKRSSVAILSIRDAVKLIAKPKPVEPSDHHEEGVTSSDTPSNEDASTGRPPCPGCGGEDFFPDGTCRACIPEDPETIIDTPSEAVCEPPEDDVDDEAPEEPDEPESAGSMLESALRLTIDHWLEQYPDAPECLVLSILESLTADWRRA